MLGLVDQLGQSEETLAIKDGELPVEKVSGARISLVCPFFGNSESASGCTLQYQGFYTGD